MLVEKADLGIANARIMAGFVTVNQLIGPAIGALLFTIGMAIPFAVQATCVALGAVLISRIGTPKGAVRENVDTHVRQDIVEGVRWLIGNRPVRTLALVIITFNITWAAPTSVLVLWALQRVGIEEAGFGLLTTATALGGLVATFSYGWLEQPGPAGPADAARARLRGGLPPGDGADDVAVDGVPADVLLRRLRVRVGNAVQRRAPARGADRVPGAGRVGLHDLRDGRHAHRLTPRRA